MRLSALAILFLAAPALGQVAADASRPVDQAVGDLDPLSHSLRVVDPGLAQFSRRNALQRLPDGSAMPLNLPGMPTYVYREPGVRAYIRRPEYLTYNPEAGGIALNAAPAVDGMYRALVPADTVFDLTGETVRRPTADTAADPNWIDRRLDTRIGRLGPSPLTTRVDARYTGGAVGNADLGAGVPMNGLSPAAYWQRRRAAELREQELPIEALLPSETPPTSE